MFIMFPVPDDTGAAQLLGTVLARHVTHLAGVNCAKNDLSSLQKTRIVQTLPTLVWYSRLLLLTEGGG